MEKCVTSIREGTYPKWPEEINLFLPYNSLSWTCDIPSCVHPGVCSRQAILFSIWCYHSHINKATELIYSYKRDFSQCSLYTIFTKHEVRLYFTKSTLKPGLVFSSWTHELSSISLSYLKQILIIETLLAWHKPPNTIYVGWLASEPHAHRCLVHRCLIFQHLAWTRAADTPGIISSPHLSSCHGLLPRGEVPTQIRPPCPRQCPYLKRHLWAICRSRANPCYPIWICLIQPSQGEF